MPTRNVVLTDHQAYFVEQLVTSGRYQNASEVLREGLRLVERRESEDELRLTALREAADALSDGQATAKQSQERLAAWQLLQKASNAKAARVRAGLDNKLSTWQNQDDALAAEGLYQNALTAQRLAWVNTQITLGGGFDAAANHTESAGK